MRPCTAYQPVHGDELQIQYCTFADSDHPQPHYWGKVQRYPADVQIAAAGAYIAASIGLGDEIPDYIARIAAVRRVGMRERTCPECGHETAESDGKEYCADHGLITNGDKVRSARWKSGVQQKLAPPIPMKEPRPGVRVRRRRRDR